MDTVGSAPATAEATSGVSPMAESCFSNPALPLVAPAATGYAGPSGGFRPSDAALVHAGQNAGESRDGLISTWAVGKDALRETLENRFQAERSIKEVELNTERKTAALTAEIAAVRVEIMSKVSEEAARTRDLVSSHFANATAAQLADAKAEIMFLRNAKKVLVPGAE